MITAAAIYRYLIDAEDKIIFVNPEWLAFARENGAPELTETQVLGRSLWGFIDGVETQDLFRALVARVRVKGSPIVVPFRCDSPTLCREMRMTMRPSADGMIRFECVTTHVTPRSYLNLLDRNVSRRPDSIDMCSNCKRILVTPQGWINIDEAAARLHLLDEEHVPHIRQSVCDVCEQL